MQKLSRDTCESSVTFQKYGDNSHHKKRAQVISHEFGRFGAAQRERRLDPERRQKADGGELEATVEKEEEDHEAQHEPLPGKGLLKMLRTQF